MNDPLVQLLTSPQSALMTDTLSARPTINGKFFGVKLAPIRVTRIRFSDRIAGHSGIAAALLQSVQLLRHLLNFFENVMFWFDMDIFKSSLQWVEFVLFVLIFLQWSVF